MNRARDRIVALVYFCNNGLIKLLGNFGYLVLPVVDDDDLFCYEIRNESFVSSVVSGEVLSFFANLLTNNDKMLRVVVILL